MIPHRYIISYNLVGVIHIYTYCNTSNIAIIIPPILTWGHLWATSNRRWTGNDVSVKRLRLRRLKPLEEGLSKPNQVHALVDEYQHCAGTWSVQIYTSINIMECSENFRYFCCSIVVFIHRSVSRVQSFGVSKTYSGLAWVGDNIHHSTILRPWDFISATWAMGVSVGLAAWYRCRCPNEARTTKKVQQCSQVATFICLG